jgi:hypothetical protein
MGKMKSFVILSQESLKRKGHFESLEVDIKTTNVRLKGC